LTAAFNAARQCGVVALAASGYRVGQERHHELAIESLRYTIEVNEETARRLQAYRRRRAVSDYERAGSTTPEEAAELRGLATSLLTRIEDWLATQHPELVK